MPWALFFQVAVSGISLVGIPCNGYVGPQHLEWAFCYWIKLVSPMVFAKSSCSVKPSWKRNFGTQNQVTSAMALRMKKYKRQPPTVAIPMPFRGHCGPPRGLICIGIICRRLLGSICDFRLFGANHRHRVPVPGAGCEPKLESQSHEIVKYGPCVSDI